MRDYRKGNWTVSETIVLIEAKKMDDERRTMKRSPVMAGGGKMSMEPRWKWVEDYCWRKGCHRSQNQCNDKWDNLMRDYKKVRDYELRQTGNGGSGGESAAVASSYWKMEKTERKERNLPANMIPQIYEALVDVVERKGGSSTAVATTSQLLLPGIAANAVTSQPATMLTPLPQHQRSYFPSSALFAVPDQPARPLPPLLLQEGMEPPQQARPPRPTRESEGTSQEHSDSPAKRRRTARGGGENRTGETRDVGAAIARGATVISDAIRASDEREERRHRDMVSLQERRLRIEEAKNEIDRQGINGVVDAINRLATSIQALASSSSSSASKNSNTDNTNNQPPP